MFIDQSFSLEKLPEFSTFITAVLNENDELRVKSSDFTEAPMAEIHSFRKKQYLERRLDYLCELSTEEKGCEYCIDERSQHFWIEHNSEIVGSMQATPYPFELIGLGEYFSDLADAYQKHIEFGRFVIQAESKHRILTRKLLASAFIYATQQYLGVIAACRTPQKRLFERFGLHAINQIPIILPERQNGAYWMLEGNCDDMCHAILKRDTVQKTELILT